MFFLKEKIHKHQIIALIFIIPGGLLLCLNDWLNLGHQYHWGVIIGLISGLCYSGYIYTLRKANINNTSKNKNKNANEKSPNTLSILTITTFSAMIFLLIIAIATGEHLTLGTPSNYAWVSAYALVSQVIGWGLISYALPKVNVSVAAFILILQPTLSFIWDVLFFNRITPWFEWLGIIIILTAVSLANHTHSSH
ncbi:DMT family transporter [Piscirickettsia litoralis]|uniref:DMT family transporter n=1 Tax=Piscirickettsia litoralis TaxID=1891921 RepID=UPI001F275E03|nr:DMT family transporter [Piscirickettsia litoralis]